MMSKDYIEAKLEELKKEQRIWQTHARHYPWQYVMDYVGVLGRRIAAYENLLPKAEPIIYGSKAGRWTQ